MKIERDIPELHFTSADPTMPKPEADMFKPDFSVCPELNGLTV